MSLSNNELLLVDAIAYYAELSDNNYETIGDFIEDVKLNGYKTVFDRIPIYDDEDLGMDKIIDLIDGNYTLKRLVMVYPQKYGDTSTSSVCFVDPDTFDVYVIYVGNYNDDPYEYESEFLSTWNDNIKGAAVSDTAEQRRDLDFYKEAIQAARDYIGNQDGDLNITVSGHSTGGNHAQYVTIAYNKNLTGYEEINDIDKCVSFDGQGFSNAFLDKYSEAIEERASKIISYCPTVAIVGALIKDIPGIEHKYIDIGSPEALLIGYHMPVEMLDENGKFKTEGFPSTEFILLKAFSSSAITITENLPGVDIENFK